MTDIVIEWNPALAAGDWTIADGSLATSQTGSDDLKTAVLVSLFTDRVAPPDSTLPANDPDPRGWWADTYEDEPIGSLLWMLCRAKKSDAKAVLLQARTYCQQALQWLLRTGVAATVDVTTLWITPTALGILVVIKMPSGEAFPYAWTWQGF